MKWIEYTQEFDGNAIGKTVELDDAVADVLVKTKTAKAASTPAAVSAATLTQSETDTVIDQIVATRLKGLVPQGKRFQAIIDPSERPITKEWATARRTGAMKHFPNTDEGRESAYRLGRWFFGIVARSMPGSYGYLSKSTEWCGKNGLSFEVDNTKATGQLENVNFTGGFLVPIEFDNQLIDLREKYGVFRQSIKVTPMASDTKLIPRRKSGVNTTFIGEGVAGTESTKTWDQVQLVAKKLMTLLRYSNELTEDAIINIGDDLAGEIAYEFALKEDQCGFIGDGTSTYGGIIGVGPAILALGAAANILGLTVGAAGTGANWNGFTLANFNNVVGTLPEYADNPANTKWYTSKAFWGSTMQRLATAAGGNKVMDIVDGVPVKEFLGYQVVVTQVMPKTAANNSIVAFFGDLSKSTAMGDRRMTTLKVSDSALNAFEQDQLIIRGTERFDINVHDVGELSTSTGALARDPQVGPLAGPIVALSTASS